MKIRYYLGRSNLARFPVPLTRREIYASLHLQII